jgi:hypothetical protein
MNRQNGTKTRPRNRQLTESVICAIAGGFIGEMARQMVQYDQVPIWRVLILVMSALFAGYVGAFSFLRSRQKSTVSSE